MARTPSNMLALGTPLPRAQLSDADGRSWQLADCAGERGLLVMFICNHCPFVIHIAPFLATLAERLQDLGISCVAINSNDILAYPDDAPAKMPAFADKYRLSFPYLVDASQEVARAFDAACTPDFFLFDAAGRLVYRGQLDDSRPGTDIPVTGVDLLGAAEQLSRGDTPNPEGQKPSLGCNIKWKPA